MTVGDEKFYRARVTKREEFASDLWMIRIQPGGEFKFAPGPICHARCGARWQADGASLFDCLRAF